MLAGVVDTTGIMDSSVAFLAGIPSDSCDFRHGGYYGAAYKNGAVYALYERTIYPYDLPYFWKLDPSLTTTEKYPVKQDFFRVQEKADRSGFYALFHDAENPYVCRLGELHLDGSATVLSADMSFEAEKDKPLFSYTNDHIYTAASNEYQYTEVRKYDLDGNLLERFDTGYETRNIYSVLGGVLLIQKPIGPPSKGGPKPVKLRLFDRNLKQIGYREFGYEYLTVTDVDLDPVLGTLTMIGTVGHSYQYPNEKNKKVYFFHAKLKELFPSRTRTDDEGTGLFYPNPNQETSIFLRFEDAAGQLAGSNPVIRFFDVRGNAIDPAFQKVGENLYEIHSSDLAAGTYTGVVESPDGKRLFSQLFVVDR